MPNNNFRYFIVSSCFILKKYDAIRIECQAKVAKPPGMQKTPPKRGVSFKRCIEIPVIQSWVVWASLRMLCRVVEKIGDLLSPGDGKAIGPPTNCVYVDGCSWCCRYGLCRGAIGKNPTVALMNHGRRDAFEQRPFGEILFEWFHVSR